MEDERDQLAVELQQRTTKLLSELDVLKNTLEKRDRYVGLQCMYVWMYVCMYVCMYV